MADSSREFAARWQKIRERLTELQSVDRQTSQGTLEEKLAARARLLRNRVQAPEEGQERFAFLAFRKGGGRYALPVDSVSEIQPLVKYSPYPGAPDFIRGVVQCRGSILSLIDVGRLLHVQESGLVDIHKYVVVEAAGRKVAMAAGEVEDLLHLTESEISPMPPHDDPVLDDWVAGVYDGSRLILRPDRLLRHERLVSWKGAARASDQFR